MKYLVLIYGDEKSGFEPGTQEFGEMMSAYNAFTQETHDKGAFVSGEALHPTMTATTVRIRDGQALTTDGPFAETKEQLGGYYVLDCKDLDDAIQWAGKIPGAKYGSIEVRPIFDFSAVPA